MALKTDSFPPTGPLRPALLLTLAIVLVASAICHRAMSVFNFFDMSAFMDAGWRIVCGQRIYADFFFNTGPVHPYLMAAFFAVFGFTKWAILAHLALVTAVVMVTVFLLARRHLDLAVERDRVLLRPVPVDRVKGHYVPSITFTMKRVAELFGARAVGVLLTGMGDDGVEGMAAIRKAGGHTIAESEESAIVFGMPRVAAEKGAAELVLPLSQIAGALAKFILE